MAHGTHIIKNAAWPTIGMQQLNDVNNWWMPFKLKYEKENSFISEFIGTMYLMSWNRVKYVPCILHHCITAVKYERAQINICTEPLHCTGLDGHFSVSAWGVRWCSDADDVRYDAEHITRKLTCFQSLAAFCYYKYIVRRARPARPSVP